MTAAEIARALGGAYRSGRWWRCRCPVHGSKSASLALKDGDRALICYCHAGCTRREVLEEIERLGLLEAGYSAPPLARTAAAADDAARRRAMARRLWDAAKDARGSPAQAYLRSRGITILIPRVLRWTPSCWHPTGSYCGAMVSRVDNVDGEFVGVHRTYLRPDGSGKAPLIPQRAHLGAVKGGGVQLAPAGEHLLVGEGLETCLSAMQACREPTWAATSNTFLESLVLPPAVRQVTILVDNDRHGAGLRSAKKAGYRWVVEGRRVRLVLSPEPGTDCNDILLGRADAQVRHVA